MQLVMGKTEMSLGYVSLPGRGANDRFLAQVAARLQDRGLKLAAGSYVVQVGKRRFARVVLA